MLMLKTDSQCSHVMVMSDFFGRVLASVAALKSCCCCCLYSNLCIEAMAGDQGSQK